MNYEICNFKDTTSFIGYIDVYCYKWHLVGIQLKLIMKKMEKKNGDGGPDMIVNLAVTGRPASKQKDCMYNFLSEKKGKKKKEEKKRGGGKGPTCEPQFVAVDGGGDMRHVVGDG